MKIVIIFTLLFNTVIAQDDFIPKMKGESGENIVTVDSLSFKTIYFSSKYYVILNINEPYTGKVSVDYNGNGIDTINVLNGYQDGWSKVYFKKDNSLQLYKISYFEQNKRFWLTNTVEGTNKKYSFIRVDTEFNSSFYEIIRKKNIIKIKKKVTTAKSVKKSVIRFKTMEQYKCFVKEIPYVYIYCEQAGFFN